MNIKALRLGLIALLISGLFVACQSGEQDEAPSTTDTETPAIQEDPVADEPVEDDMDYDDYDHEHDHDDDHEH